MPRVLADSETLSHAVTIAAYFLMAWTITRVSAIVLDRLQGKHRPYPRLLKDLVAVAVYTVAFIATLALVMGQGAIGALTGTSVVLALLGFAIRNVVADTLTGVALTLEGPFRIGDWIDIDTLATGKVIEIGWRTTRILTPDATYMILPNSQIARQRVTNYSAPKPEYRAQVTITLDHILPIGEARSIMLAALEASTLIRQSPPPDIRVISYDEGGIRYTVRYWVRRFEQHVDCRDEVYTLIDDALRRAGSIAPYRRIELVGPGFPVLPPPPSPAVSEG